MKHRIRQTVYDWHGEKKQVVKEIDCELGTGFLDKHGREIFEGDIIQTFGYDNRAQSWVRDKSRVTFDYGTLWIDALPMFEVANGQFEIVGHIAEEE